LANPDPAPEHRWKPGQSGNPGGINSETHRLIKDSAEKAARLQNLLLEGVLAKIASIESAEDREAILRADINKIIIDALDRHLGKATQQIDNTSSDGTMSPKLIVGDAVLDAIRAKHVVKES
jgi:hypothetical protein